VQCHDLGLMAEPRGKYSLWLGGTESGMSPEHGTLVRKGIPREQVIPVVKCILETYIAGAEEYKGELSERTRLYHVIEKTGLERFKKAIEEFMSNTTLSK